MGIDLHAINFLGMAKRRKALGNTITIGRQTLQLQMPFLQNLWPEFDRSQEPAYCEELLIARFGSTQVESIDHSDYERATHIHDMNRPLPAGLKSRYDTVIDGGCLEHIYNAPQALWNCSELCRPGGQIIHVLPANNFCGHGFWQFSPELFFSLYSDKNGYAETEVYLADLTNTSQWFRVREPSEGKRVNVFSSTALYVLVRTVLRDAVFSHSNIQQSDYIYEWQKNSPRQGGDSGAFKQIKELIKKIPYLKGLASWLRGLLRDELKYARLDARNPGLIPVRIRDACQN